MEPIVMYSTDGINWTTTEAPDTTQVFAVTYGNGKFVQLVVLEPTSTAIQLMVLIGLYQKLHQDPGKLQ